MKNIKMISVGEKNETKRCAKAKAEISMRPETLKIIREGKLEKGDVFTSAKLAGITAAKKTSEIIPLCHPILITGVDINFSEVSPNTIEIVAAIESWGRTGVEMEALTAVTVSALTIYDMAKPIDKEMKINEIYLLEKMGGKSRTYKSGAAETETEAKAEAAVITISDSASCGKITDISGPTLKEELEKEHIAVSYVKILPDEEEKIVSELRTLAGKYDFIFLTGGTGIGPRDVTPEAVKKVIEKEIPGIGELLRQKGEVKTPFSFLSRCFAGIMGKTIVICLPGSPEGAKDAIRFLFPQILHTLPMIKGEKHQNRGGRQSAFTN